MKSFHSILIMFAVTILGLIIIGCGEDLFITDGSYTSPSDDSTRACSAKLTLLADTVLYRHGTVAEVTGYVIAKNCYSQPIAGVWIELYFSDSRIEVVYSNPALQDTTDERGRVDFTLRSTDCAGWVRVNVYYRSSLGSHTYGDSHTLVFLKEEQQPAYLITSATPETLYTDLQHRDSTLIKITVLDEQRNPIPGFNVVCFLLSGIARTDSAGIVSNYYNPPPLAYERKCASVYVGALRERVCFSIVPWDSIHGGD